MLQFFVQVIVLLLAVGAAGLKSLHFAASNVTEFELDRRLKAGDDEARAERQFRHSRPLLDALRRLTVLVLTIIIVIILATAYNFVLAIIWALAWLLVIEFLSSRNWLVRQSEGLSMKYEPQMLKAAHALQPVLQFLADNRALGGAGGPMFYSKDELLREVEHDSHVLDRNEKLLIRQALRYQDILVRDIMTPRSVLTTVEEGDTIGPLLLDRLHKSGHSRFPVIREDLDHVVGILYMHELVPLNPKAKKVSDAMSRKVFYVHQDKALDHVLQAFLRTKHHLFMVVNEFEEVMGVVSIEDVLETIIGRKIVDEFDQYEDLRAVAKLAADQRRKTRQALGD